MPPAVHQFHQGIRRRDAIGEEMLVLRSLLRGEGYASEIIVGEEPPEDLAGEVLRLSDYRGDAGSLLLVHHSIGHPFGGIVGSLPDSRVIVYHNITPPRFFPENLGMRQELQRGRRQLRYYRGVASGAIANSSYSAVELRAAGFFDVEVLPPCVGRLAREAARGSLTDPAAPLVLFVGRAARNKGQVDLVAAFEAFVAHFAPRARLVLCGDRPPGEPYSRILEERVAASPCREQIDLAGLVTDRELADLRARAAVYVSMSEHEGFGVPLLEAFAAGIPVLAFRSSAVAETMGGAGILFSRKDPNEVAALMAEVTSDEEFRTRVVERQFRRLKEPDLSGAGDHFLRLVKRWLPERRGGERARRPRRPLGIRVEGPFETAYGLAVANRTLAQGLDSFTPHRVSIHCTEGTGDYLPRQADLDAHPAAARLWGRTLPEAKVDVVIRNTYPPVFRRRPGALNLAYFFWEESLVPAGWVEGFNSAFDAVLVPTRYVREVLVRSGVKVPVEVVPPAVEGCEALAAGPDRRPGRSSSGVVRFLSVGSAFPRKGVDVLLRAYFRAFKASDPVHLTIKSFPNPHNTVATLLAELREACPDGPAVEQIDADLPAGELDGLYSRSDVLVHPTRGEGFGYPVVEAMFRGIPVIATAAGGLADFCSDETAFIVPHVLVPSGSHFGVPGSEWAEPDESALAALLSDFAGGRLREEAERRARRAREQVTARYTPGNAAPVVASAIETIFEAQPPTLSVGFVSTWNSKCGIALYTHDLVTGFAKGTLRPTFVANTDTSLVEPDGPETFRAWARVAGDYRSVADALLEADVDVAHVQVHRGIFGDYAALSRVMVDLAERGVPVLATVHVTGDHEFHGREISLADLIPGLERAERVLVHARADAEELARAGLRRPALVIPMGNVLFPSRERASLAREMGLSGRRVVASFGFALPHKGVLETIEAVGLLRERIPGILYLALAAERPEIESVRYLEACRSRIEELGLQSSVLLIPGFLPDAEAAALLQCAEAVVLAYQATRETSSAAVRFPLGCGRATLTTPVPMFENVRDAVLQIPGGTPESIAEGLRTVLEDDALRLSLEEKAAAHARRNSWPEVSRLHLDLYREALKVRRK